MMMFRIGTNITSTHQPEYPAPLMILMEATRKITQITTATMAPITTAVVLQALRAKVVVSMTVAALVSEVQDRRCTGERSVTDHPRQPHRALATAPPSPVCRVGGIGLSARWFRSDQCAAASQLTPAPTETS